MLLGTFPQRCYADRRRAVEAGQVDVGIRIGRLKTSRECVSSIKASTDDSTWLGQDHVVRRVSMIYMLLGGQRRLSAVQVGDVIGRVKWCALSHDSTPYHVHALRQ